MVGSCPLEARWDGRRAWGGARDLGRLPASWTACSLGQPRLGQSLASSQAHQVKVVGVRQWWSELGPKAAGL